ncbi:MAG: Maf family protein [Acidobacteriia bacterium]|nr:Maf family protein [Terriglobia bacterium]
MPLFLASASPRRLALLLESGLDPVPCPTGVPEEPLPGESAEAHVLRLASAKGRHALARLAASRATGLVLAADTAVVLGGAILGKPADDADAAAMLRRLSGRAHEVLTGVFLARIGDARHAEAVESTRVTFRPFGESTVLWYVGTGEPRDKAGAYGIQGRGAALVLGIEGSWSNVVGLPLEILPRLYAAIGEPWPAAASPPRPE